MYCNMRESRAKTSAKIISEELFLSQNVHSNLHLILLQRRGEKPKKTVSTKDLEAMWCQLKFRKKRKERQGGG